MTISRFAWRRRRRLLYLLAIVGAPLGIRRPNTIRDEIQALIDREFRRPGNDDRKHESE